MEKRIQEILNEIELLTKNIRWFEEQIQPEDSGWIYTTINGLKHRIKYLSEQL